MLHDLSGILDSGYFNETKGISLSCFLSFFKFHECPVDIYCKTEKKRRVAACKN